MTTALAGARSVSPSVVLLMFVLAGFAAWYFGSWPALLLLLLTRAVQDRKAAAGRELLLVMIPGGWLLLQWISGDRRLFFSWSLGLAACALTSGVGRGRLRRLSSGVSVVIVFLMIRIQQQALPRVLFIETLAAAGILSVTLLLHGGRPGRLFSDALVVAAASILACFSLAL